MSAKTRRSIIILMLLIIGALFITQAYWFKKAFTLQERQLDEKLNIALRSVADQLLILDNDSTSRIPPITKISSNEYYVETKAYFSLLTLDSCLRSEFLSRNITANFDYVIQKSDDDVIILGNTVYNLENTDDVACKVRLDGNEDLNFKVRINNKTAYLINSMGIWIYSSLSLLAILAVFTFIMISIIKGRKLALLKRDFVNNMTHELKTPIANIAVASDAIRNRNIQMDEKKLEKYADIIYNENVRLHNLVDRVLQISSIEKKEESLHFEEVDIHEIINGTVISFEALIQQKDGHIKTLLEADRFTINADKTHLTNVIYNIIDNAIKYSSSSPEIVIRTSNSKKGINIEIEDKGIGMSKAIQERIFEKFFRAESGDLHNTKGHGLGLSYVKIIVEKHNGSISFKSAEGIGSTFSLSLPL